MRKPFPNAITIKALRRDARVYAAMSRTKLAAPLTYIDDDGEDVGSVARITDTRYRAHLAAEVLSNLFHAGVGPEFAVGADPVVGQLVDGREVFLHNIASRVGQRLWIDVARRAIDAAVPATVSSYAVGRSRLGALAHARTLMRNGFGYAHRFDVRDFFGSIGADLVLRALSARTNLHESMQQVIRFFLAPSIIRHRDHPHVLDGSALPWEPARNVLLQGSVAAPMLSNIVGSHVLDHPFTVRMTRHAVLLRYADDGLILVRERWRADGALELVRDLLEDAGMRLHSEKTTVVSVATHKEPIMWLGKSLYGREVWTPTEWAADQLSDAASLDPHDPARYSKVRSVVDELQLDPPGRLRVAFRLAVDVGLGEMFDGVVRRAARRRIARLRGYDATMPLVVRQALAS